MIRPATLADADAIAKIYNHYIVHTWITFEEEVVSSDEMAKRMAAIASSSLPWLVAELAGGVAGYAYANKWKDRSAYRFAAEVTVYLDAAACGKGIGTQLYETLFTILKGAGFHAVIGGIALPNPASIALHEKLGLRKVAHFPELGYKFEQWIDVGYWQLTL